jgi:hypothetical protein
MYVVCSICTTISQDYFKNCLAAIILAYQQLSSFFSDQVKNLAMTLSSAQLCRANEEAKQKEGSPYNTLVIDRSHSVDTFNEVSRH